MDAYDSMRSYLQLYGGVYNLIQNGLPKIGIEVTMVDIFDLEKVRQSLKSKFWEFSMCLKTAFASLKVTRGWSGLKPAQIR